MEVGQLALMHLRGFTIYNLVGQYRCTMLDVIYWFKEL